MNRLQDYLIQIDPKEISLDLVINRYVADASIDKNTLRVCCSKVESGDEKRQIKVKRIQTVPEAYKSIIDGLAAHQPALTVSGSELKESITNLSTWIYPVGKPVKRGLLTRMQSFFG